MIATFPIDTAMPKQQASLDSFFGVQNKKKQQKTLTSFFKKGTENNSNDDLDGDANVVKRESPTMQGSNKRRKRQAIIDSEDEEDFEPMTVEATPEKDEKKGTGSEEKEQRFDDGQERKAKTTEPKNETKVSPTVTPPSTKKESAAFFKTKEEAGDKEEAEERNESKCPHRAKLVKQAKKLAKLSKVEASVDSISTPVLYQELVETLEKIEAITGRLEIQGLLTKLFRRILQTSPKDLYSVIYLASNSIAPAYECVELGIGDSILIKAIGEAYGTNPSKLFNQSEQPCLFEHFSKTCPHCQITIGIVKEQYQGDGDLGTVAKSCKSKQRTLGFGIKPKPLTVARVLNVFREIAAITGSQSQKLKVDKIKKLLVAAQVAAETKYIIRGLQGKLRIGLAQSTVLISLAHALSFTIPESVDCTKQGDEEDANAQVFQDDSVAAEKRLEAAVNMVKQVYSEVPSYDALLDAALKVPLVAIHEACAFQPGIPVTPMLAKPTKSIQEVLNRLNGLAFTCEFKYDGERAQIHKTPDGKLKVFSRNLLETTSKYPEVPLFVQESAIDGVDSFVLDAEVVAYNPKTGQLVPFQVLSTRKKTEESAETAKVQVIVQAFDLMFLNGKSLLNTKLEDRRALMLKNFLPVEGKFQYAKSLDFVEDGDTSALEQFLDTAVKGQCEGLMVKTMQDVYEPSRRSLNWLKLKKDYLDGLGDSFDLVPLGAYFGKGKRTGVYGAYLLACYDEDAEEFQSVCKIGTGFSDEDLQSFSKALNEHKLDSKSSQYNVSDSLECDVWFDAVQVWEIKAADLSKSSSHRAAIGKTGEAGRGIGLRFPRFERIRDDKKPEEATTSDQVLDIYYDQDAVKGQEGNVDDDEDDGI